MISVNIATLQGCKVYRALQRIILIGSGEREAKVYNLLSGYILLSLINFDKLRS